MNKRKDNKIWFMKILYFLNSLQMNAFASTNLLRAIFLILANIYISLLILNIFDDYITFTFQATTKTTDSIEIKEVNNCKLRKNASILSSFGNGEILFLVAQQLYISSCFCVFVFVFCVSYPTQIQTHKSTHNQTKLKSILTDLIWLKVLRNSCTVSSLK